jgi:histidine ammonia-lyase
MARSSFQRAQAERCVAIELAGAGDNPLVLVAADEILSNAGFDVTAMTIAFEALGLALAHCAGTAVRRVGQLLHAETSGLPRFLAAGGKAQTGFATVQKTLSALEGEIRHLAMPATLGVIPVADGIEDHAGLAPYVVQKTRRIANRLWRIAAIELMAAAQAIELRDTVAALGPPMRETYTQTRASAATLDDTRAPGPEIDRLARAIAGVALRDD